MATLQELADYCGVSISTVSRALRDVPLISLATRQRVRAAADAMGYTASPLAAGLRTGKHRMIAIATPPLGPWFYARAIRGIEAVLHRSGYSFFLIDTAVQDDGSRRPFSRSSVEKRSDGVIALGIDLTEQEREDLAKVGKPVVVVGAPVHGLHSIGIDDRAATRLAMQHLMRLGHRFIAHLGGDNDYGLESAVAVTRRGEWGASLQRNGITVQPSWFTSGRFTVAGAKDASMRLLQHSERPTAIFAASDEMAFGAVLAARDLGIEVPGSLSIVGIDDHAWSEPFGLTTVHQDPYAQGGSAASLLLEQIEGARLEPAASYAPIALVVRSSTGSVALETTQNVP